jgi:hypothetical protein
LLKATIPALFPPGETITRSPSMSGDSLIIQCGFDARKLTQDVLAPDPVTHPRSRRTGEVAVLSQDIDAIARRWSVSRGTIPTTLALSLGPVRRSRSILPVLHD